MRTHRLIKWSSMVLLICACLAGPTSTARAQNFDVVLSEPASACLDAAFGFMLEQITSPTFMDPLDHLDAACASATPELEATEDAAHAVDALRMTTGYDWGSDAPIEVRFVEIVEGLPYLALAGAKAQDLAILASIQWGFELANSLANFALDMPVEAVPGLLAAAWKFAFPESAAIDDLISWHGLYFDHTLLTALARDLPDEATLMLRGVHVDGPGSVLDTLREVAAARMHACSACLVEAWSAPLLAEHEDTLAAHGGALFAQHPDHFGESCLGLTGSILSAVEARHLMEILGTPNDFDFSTIVAREGESLSRSSLVFTVDAEHVGLNGGDYGSAAALAQGGFSSLIECPPTTVDMWPLFAVHRDTTFDIFDGIFTAAAGCEGGLDLLVRGAGGLATIPVSLAAQPIAEPSSPNPGDPLAPSSLFGVLSTAAEHSPVEVEIGTEGQLIDVTPAMVEQATEERLMGPYLAIHLNAPATTTFAQYLTAYGELEALCAPLGVTCRLYFGESDLPTLAEWTGLTDFGVGSHDPLALILPGSSPHVEPTSRETIQRVLREHRRMIRHCYERELMADATLEGRVMVQFLIEPSGEVSSAEITSNDTGNSDLGDCIAERFLTITFPTGDGVVTVNYPFTFTSE